MLLFFHPQLCLPLSLVAKVKVDVLQVTKASFDPRLLTVAYCALVNAYNVNEQ